MGEKNNCEQKCTCGQEHNQGQEQPQAQAQMQMQDEAALFQLMDKWLDENYPEMESELCKVLSYPTLEGEPSEGAPFGPVL